MGTRPGEAYRAKSIRFLELWQTADWRVKLYALTGVGQSLPQGAAALAKRAFLKRLAWTVRCDDALNIAFALVDATRPGLRISSYWWSEGVNLRRDVCLAAPTSSADGIAPEGDFLACIEELRLIAFERDAWVACALTAGRIDGYLEAMLVTGP